MPNIALVYFSPTGNTKKALTAACKLPCANISFFDVTTAHNLQETDLSGFDLVIFGSPVYSGRLPQCSLDRFAFMKGSRTPCVLMVTFGNRAYEDALREFFDLVTPLGFCVRGAAAVVAQHTYGMIQPGRPAEDDLVEIENFLIHVLAHTDESTSIIVPGNFPYREAGKKNRFRPTTNANCVECGMCVKDCPVGAIAEDCRTINEDCIGCLRCVKNCPMKAKAIVEPEFADFEKYFTEKLKRRLENEFFV